MRRREPQLTYVCAACRTTATARPTSRIVAVWWPLGFYSTRLLTWPCWLHPSTRCIRSRSLGTASAAASPPSWAACSGKVRVDVGCSLGSWTQPQPLTQLRAARDTDMPNLHVYTFSTMPCMSRELAGRCSEFVTTVVNGDDVVPRLHRQNIDKLRAEVRHRADPP